MEGKKRCARCQQWLVFNLDDPKQGDYTILKRTLADGSIRRRPAGSCRRCQLERRREVEQQQDPEVLREQRRKRRNDYNRRHRKQVREYAREYATVKRREAGIEPRNFKRRRHREKRQLVDPAPFLAWLDEWLAATGATEAALLRQAEQVGQLEPGSLDRALYRWRHEATRAEVGVLDYFAVAMGMPDQIVVLYPVEDEQAAA